MFDDRIQAGIELAGKLQRFSGKDVVVLGIPRGGVVVANEVAKALGAPLDVIVAKKIGAPGEPEYALGAVAEDGAVVMNREEAALIGTSESYIQDQAREKRSEIKERLQRLRGEAPQPEVKGKTVIIVDDGIATGSTVEAAVASVRMRQPGKVVVAVPVAPVDAVQRLSEDGVEVVCLYSPTPFFAIGEFYRDFGQVDDAEVKRILENDRAGRNTRQPS